MINACTAHSIVTLYARLRHGIFADMSPSTLTFLRGRAEAKAMSKFLSEEFGENIEPQRLLCLRTVGELEQRLVDAFELDDAAVLMRLTELYDKYLKVAFEAVADYLTKLEEHYEGVKDLSAADDFGPIAYDDRFIHVVVNSHTDGDFFRYIRCYDV